MKLLTAFILTLIPIFSIFAQSGDADPVTASALTGINLPGGALRVREENIPAEIKGPFAKFFAGGDKFGQGEVEVLAWPGKKSGSAGGSAKLRGQIESAWRAGGWDYEIGGQENGVTFFSLSKTAPARQNVFGFWVPTGDGTVLALTELVAPRTAALDGPGGGKNPVRAERRTNADSSAESFDLPASADHVNVMGTAMPNLPAFPSVARKPNRLRGYVKDLKGNPLAGAYVGVRSSALGGRYSAASAETDASGYYETEVPFGAAHFYAAGYTIDYGAGRAAVALHPVDGKAGSFVSADGAVENFVLLSYGIADRDDVSQRPWNPNNYYGGAIRVSYDLSSGNMWATKGSLPPSAEIEITLTPDGDMLDGTAGKSFRIRRPAAGINNFYINNIPVGRYRIGARLAGGKQLKLKKNAYDQTPLFGLQSAESIGTATILFKPDSAKTLSAQPNRGDWDAAEVKLELP